MWKTCGLLIALLAVSTVSANWADEACTPGQIKMDDCNVCLCVDDGTRYDCTGVPCEPTRNSPETYKRITKRNADTCTPGESFKFYCNTCMCGNEGLKTQAACTRKGCGVGVWREDGTLINPA